MFLPTNEQDLFTHKVVQLKQQKLKHMLRHREVPLRDGVQQV